MMADVLAGEIINIEGRTNHWRVKYTAKVKSYSIKYIALEPEQLLLLYQKMESIIKYRENKRDG